MSIYLAFSPLFLSSNSCIYKIPSFSFLMGQHGMSELDKQHCVVIHRWLGKDWISHLPGITSDLLWCSLYIGTLEFFQNSATLQPYSSGPECFSSIRVGSWWILSKSWLNEQEALLMAPVWSHNSLYHLNSREGGVSSLHSKRESALLMKEGVKLGNNNIIELLSEVSTW